MPISEPQDLVLSDIQAVHGRKRPVNQQYWAMRWRKVLTSPALPLLVAGTLYSLTLTDNLFGDEFAQYRWSALDQAPNRLALNTQLARLGYVLVGQAWAIRLHSLAFSLGSIVIVRKLAERLFDPKVAILAAWITALSPYVIEFATEARPNAIFIFAGVVFLYSLLRFLDNETWANATLLALSICFGLVARPMFVGIVAFGIGYYVCQQRKITSKVCLLLLVAVPFMIYVYASASEYCEIAPKESPDAPASLLNFVLRLPMALTFGYCTLRYPERDAGWNISTAEILRRNMMSAILLCAVGIAFLVGLVCVWKKAARQVGFLVGAVLVPVWILLLVQESGFSLLNVKHCAGVAGPYYVLMAAILNHVWRTKCGKLIGLLYAYFITVSLIHFYLQPDVYSRRARTRDLNAFLLNRLREDDYLLTYHWSKLAVPNYLTVIGTVENYVNLNSARPDCASLAECTALIDAECLGEIYLIYSSAAQAWVDPDDTVLRVLKDRRASRVHRYGRSLLLYEFYRDGSDSRAP